MMTTTGGDDGPSVFAKYIGDPEVKQLSPLETLIKQARRHADLKTFLVDILMGGPAPANLVIARGIERGFSRKQLWSAREQLKIVAFKEVGKPHGRWFLALPTHTGYPRTAGNPGSAELSGR